MHLLPDYLLQVHLCAIDIGDGHIVHFDHVVAWFVLHRGIEHIDDSREGNCGEFLVDVEVIFCASVIDGSPREVGETLRRVPKGAFCR